MRADFLLNFRAPARETEAPRRGGPFISGRNGGGRNGGGRGGGRGAPSSRARRGAHSKELFLQANFRFLVADWADLAGSSRDPDHMVDWDDVVLVELGGGAAALRCAWTTG